MSYDAVNDETCIKTDSLSPPYETTCRQNLGNDLSAKEHPCIVPFYYQGTSRHCCNLALAQETCNPELEDGGPKCQRQIDPNDKVCFDFLRLPPFSTTIARMTAQEVTQLFGFDILSNHTIHFLNLLILSQQQKYLLIIQGRRNMQQKILHSRRQAATCASGGT